MMRPYSLLPAMSAKDRVCLLTVNPSDIKKLATHHSNHNPGSRQLFGLQRGRPTSIQSLPNLPRRDSVTPNSDCRLCQKYQQEARAARAARGSIRPLPSITDQRGIKSEQTGYSFPKYDSHSRRRGRRKKSSQRCHQVFVWDHRPKEVRSKANENADQSPKTQEGGENSNKEEFSTANEENEGNSEKGRERMKRRNRTSRLLGMLGKPLLLDQLCKTPIPQTTQKMPEKQNGTFPEISRQSSKQWKLQNPSNESNPVIPLNKSRRKKNKLRKMSESGSQTKRTKHNKKDGKKLLLTLDDDGNDADDDDDADDSNVDDDDDIYDDDDDDNDDDDDDGEDTNLRNSSFSYRHLSRSSHYTMSSAEIRISGEDKDEDEEEAEDEDDTGDETGDETDEEDIDEELDEEEGEFFEETNNDDIYEADIISEENIERDENENESEMLDCDSDDENTYDNDNDDDDNDDDEEDEEDDDEEEEDDEEDDDEDDDEDDEDDDETD